MFFTFDLSNLCKELVANKNYRKTSLSSEETLFSRTLRFLRLTLMQFFLIRRRFSHSLARISNHTIYGNIVGVKRYSNIPQKEWDNVEVGRSSQESWRILLSLYDARRTSERRKSAEDAIVNFLVIERCWNSSTIDDSKATIALRSFVLAVSERSSVDQNVS